MNLKDCYNFEDFRKLAKRNLPAPIFHYIDGGADDETTLKRNTESFLKCDLVPNILASVGEPDLSTYVFGQKIDMPIFCTNSNAKTLSSRWRQSFSKSSRKIWNFLQYVNNGNILN